MEAVYAHQSIHSFVYDVTIANKVLSKGVVEEANKYIMLFNVILRMYLITSIFQ
jgi:hypothetical protein